MERGSNKNTKRIADVFIMWWLSFLCTTDTFAITWYLANRCASHYARQLDGRAVQIEVGRRGCAHSIPSTAFDRRQRNDGSFCVPHAKAQVYSRFQPWQVFEMSNRSEDEWSLVSDEEVLSDMSYDEVDPEPEVVEEIETEAAERKQEIPLTNVETTETAVNTDETEDVLSLLADTSISKCSRYSREIRVSLLSPSHQEWFDGPPPRYSLSPSPRKKSTNVAFCGPAVRHRSFPDRLRALTAATRPVPGDVTPPTFTEVTAFKQDQSTQVNLDTAIPDPSRPRHALLRSALERSMVMANQLRSKSQDNERLSFRIAELESVAIQTEQKAQRKVIKLKLQERSMALAKQQAKLTADYHDNLKAIAEDLRRENARLEAQNAALRGEDEALALRSLDDLEQLETALACGMDRIRAAIRAKYRAAMEKRSEQDLCVVCFVKPISVVLLPCRHQVLCATCALRVTSCPIDRKDIQDKVLTYGLSAYSGES